MPACHDSNGTSSNRAEVTRLTSGASSVEVWIGCAPTEGPFRRWQVVYGPGISAPITTEARLGLERKTELARTGIKRGESRLQRTELKRGDTQLARTGAPAARSEKTASRLPERRAITDLLTSCELAWHSRCAGKIDGHEVVRRWAYPDGPYDPRVVIGLCRKHHQLDTFKDEAVLLGIRVPAATWEIHGYAAVDEARRVRESHGTIVPFYAIVEAVDEVPTVG